MDKAADAEAVEAVGFEVDLGEAVREATRILDQLEPEHQQSRKDRCGLQRTSDWDNSIAVAVAVAVAAAVAFQAFQTFQEQLTELKRNVIGGEQIWPFFLHTILSFCSL